MGTIWLLYSITTIIILYLVQSLHFTDQNADLFVWCFQRPFIFDAPLGGFIADRYIGFPKTILWGGCLFILGYLLTVLPSQQGFFIGLALLVVANDLFKPNVSSIVGTLYRTDDPRRDGGFTLFYMGINVGSLIPPIFIGTVVHYYGLACRFSIRCIGHGYWYDYLPHWA
ncbi:POT-type proton-dependent oligopeptide transporter [Candidatus Coxiella mudrowiae]|uniref:POT-type proton-dependent oligopeptide transporter n=1 Tax=Candidatus Coxiella mudrowiae TaxID=2054173 RepID=UPI000662ADFD|nr:MFS transporter [Candidatus Coxiella mudrowiae]